MLTILFVWTIIAAGNGGREYRDWRPMGEFSSPATCQRAVAELGVGERGRCVPK